MRTKELIEDIALQKYVYFSACNLNSRFGKKEIVRNTMENAAARKVSTHFAPIDPDNQKNKKQMKVVQIFYKALEHALAIDFREKKLTAHAIQQLANEALRAIHSSHKQEIENSKARADSRHG